MTNTKFTVIDVETTGLFPGGTDRIIEIALISLDFEGNILREYETLLNPERDLGPIHIHKITGAMVQNAPIFSDILGDLVEFLAGTIVVGHNVSFDYRFLESEFQRAGITLPTIPSICTLNLVKKVDPNIPSGKLTLLCDHYDIQLENSHSAYADCEATAKLFRILMRKYGLYNITQTLSTPLGIEDWPELPKSNICFKRSHYENLPKEKNYIADLIACLPHRSIATSEGELDYLNLLEIILADRKITSTESRLLHDLALEYNISQEKAVELHSQYLSDLIRIALLDGIISDFEMADLKQVAELLSTSEQDLNALISDTSTLEMTCSPLENRNNLKGKTVCFTGTLRSNYKDMPITRALVQKLALEHGLIVKQGVTKGLDFLVTADPDSMSSKAKKARAYNIQILAEQAFWSMLRVPVS
ncbi:MAG: hypothetical protein KAX49_13215 [Halanaerobiales bacterium]|nr:hypothetical protein [Halanaerobiales bacterium]